MSTPGAPDAPAARRRRIGAVRRGASWWSRRSVRARITLLATAAVAVAVGAAGFLAVQLLGYVLLRAVDDGARTQASELATLVSRGQLPDPLPVFGGTAALQVVDGSGHVLAASAGGDRLVPLVPESQIEAVRRGRVVELPAARLAGADPLRVVGAVADQGTTPRTVLVAVSVQDISHSVRLFGVAAGVGGPLAIASFALACAMLTGSALRPVDALRRSATRITDAGSDQRLPLPPARDEVRALAETLNAMLDRLTAAAAAQQAFVADAAHELRSPVASLRVQLEVERDHPDPGAWPATVADLLADLGRLDRLVADLLALARAEQGGGEGLRGRTATVDLLALARAAAVDPGLARAGVLIEVEGGSGPEGSPPEGSPPEGSEREGSGRDGSGPVGSGPVAGTLLVRGDPDALRGVITNLLANAAQHAYSRVGVAVSRGPVAAPRTGRGTPAGAGGPDDAGPTRTVVLTVTDDGPGIAADDRARVFDRFTRLDLARGRERGGAGLGLAIVARLVAAHGGTIDLTDAVPDRWGLRATSAAGPGLKVRVVLPGAPPAAGPLDPEHRRTAM